MSKSKPTNDTGNFSAGILVLMSRDELESIEAVVPDEMTASEWCRRILLRVARPRYEKAHDLKDDTAY